MIWRNFAWLTSTPTFAVLLCAFAARRMESTLQRPATTHCTNLRHEHRGDNMVSSNDVITHHLLKSCWSVFDHQEWVQSVCFSPDGKYLATGDIRGQILVSLCQFLLPSLDESRKIWNIAKKAFTQHSTDTNVKYVTRLLCWWPSCCFWILRQDGTLWTWVTDHLMYWPLIRSVRHRPGPLHFHRMDSSLLLDLAILVYISGCLHWFYSRAFEDDRPAHSALLSLRMGKIC